MEKERAKIHGYFFAIQTVSILGALSSIVEAYYMGKIVDHVSGEPSKVFTMVLIIGINMIFQITSNISGNYLINRYTNEKRLRISRIAADKLLNAKFRDIDNMNSGYVLDVFSSDIEKVLTFDRTVFTIGAVFVKLFVSLGCLLYMNALVSICIIAATILSLIPGMLVGNLQYEKNKQLNKKEDELNGHFMKMINLVKLIKAYTAEDYYSQRNGKYLAGYRKSRITLNNNIVIYAILNGTFGLLPYITLFLVGAIFTVMGKFTLGGIVAASCFIGILSEGIDGIQNAFSVKQSHAASKERLQTVMDLKEDKGETERAAPDKGIISFNSVSFRYGAGAKILDNFSLNIPEGSKVLLCGENGVGKSTIFRLIEGLYSPEEGYIGLKKDIVISAADQESIFFPWTVEENIRIANRQLTETEFEEICRVACIDRDLLFLGSEKRKLSSLGKNLSKGQLQRISLARALAKKADLYLFDEPTAGLTIEMEKQVLQNVIAYLKDKTVVMILHGSGHDRLFDQVLRLGPQKTV